MAPQITPADVQAWLATNPEALSQEEATQLQEIVLGKATQDVRSSVEKLLSGKENWESRRHEILEALEEFAEWNLKQQMQAYQQDMIELRHMADPKDLLEAAKEIPQLLTVAEQIVEERLQTPNESGDSNEGNLTLLELKIELVQRKLELGKPEAPEQAEELLAIIWPSVFKQWTNEQKLLGRASDYLFKCLELAYVSNIGFQEKLQQVQQESKNKRALVYRSMFGAKLSHNIARWAATEDACKESTDSFLAGLRAEGHRALPAELEAALSAYRRGEGTEEILQLIESTPKKQLLHAIAQTLHPRELCDTFPELLAFIENNATAIEFATDLETATTLLQLLNQLGKPLTSILEAADPILVKYPGSQWARQQQEVKVNYMKAKAELGLLSEEEMDFGFHKIVGDHNVEGRKGDISRTLISLLHRGAPRTPAIQEWIKNDIGGNEERAAAEADHWGYNIEEDEAKKLSPAQKLLAKQPTQIATHEFLEAMTVNKRGKDHKLLAVRLKPYTQYLQKEGAKEKLQEAFLKKFKDTVEDSLRPHRGDDYRQIALKKLSKWVQLPGAPMPSLSQLGLQGKVKSIQKLFKCTTDDTMAHLGMTTGADMSGVLSERREQMPPEFWEELMSHFLKSTKSFQALVTYLVHNAIQSPIEAEGAKAICAAMEKITPQQAKYVSYLLGVLSSNEKAAGVQLFIGLIAAAPDAIEPLKTVVDTMSLTEKSAIERGSSLFQQIPCLNVLSPLIQECIAHPALSVSFIETVNDMGSLRGGGTDSEQMETYQHEVKIRTSELTFALEVPQVKAFLLSVVQNTEEGEVAPPMINQHTKNILFLAAYQDESLLKQYVKLAKQHPQLCARGIGMFSNQILSYFDNVTTNQASRNLSDVRNRDRTQAKGHMAILSCIEKLGKAAEPYIQYLEEKNAVVVQGSTTSIPEVLEEPGLLGLENAMEDEAFVQEKKPKNLSESAKEFGKELEELMVKDENFKQGMEDIKDFGTHKKKEMAFVAMVLYAAAPPQEAKQSPTLSHCLTAFPSQMKHLADMIKKEEKMPNMFPKGVFAYLRDRIAEGTDIKNIEENYVPMAFRFNPAFLEEDPTWKMLIEGEKTRKTAAALVKGYRGRFEFGYAFTREQYHFLRARVQDSEAEMMNDIESLTNHCPFEEMEEAPKISELVKSHAVGVTALSLGLTLLPNTRRPGGKGMFSLDSQPPHITAEDFKSCKLLIQNETEEHISSILNGYLRCTKTPDLEAYKELIHLPGASAVVEELMITWEGDFDALHEAHMDMGAQAFSEMLQAAAKCEYSKEYLEAVKAFPTAWDIFSDYSAYLKKQEFEALLRKTQNTSNYPITIPEQVAILGLPFLKGKTATREELVSRTNAGLQADYLLTLHQVQAEPSLPYEMIASAQSPSKELKAKLEAQKLPWKKVKQKKGASDSISEYFNFIPTNIGEPPVFEKGSRKVKGGPVRGKTRKAFENIVKRAQHDGLEMLKYLSQQWDTLSADDVEIIEDFCEVYGTNSLENIKSYIELLKKNFPSDWNEARYVGKELFYWNKIATDEEVSGALKALIDDSRDNLYVVDKLSHIGEYYGEKAKEKVIEYAQEYLKEGSTVLEKWEREMKEYLCENIRDFCNLNKNPNKIGFRTLDPKVFERYSKLGSEEEREAFKINVLETQIQLVVSNDFRKPKDMEGEVFQFVLNELIQVSKFSHGSPSRIQQMIDEFSQLPTQAVEHALEPHEVQIKAAAAESMEANKDIKALQAMLNPTIEMRNGQRRGQMLFAEKSKEYHRHLIALLKQQDVPENEKEDMQQVMAVMEKFGGANIIISSYIMLWKADLPESARKVLEDERALFKLLQLRAETMTENEGIKGITKDQKRYSQSVLEALLSQYNHLNTLGGNLKIGDRGLQAAEAFEGTGMTFGEHESATSALKAFAKDAEGECRKLARPELDLLEAEHKHQLGELEVGTEEENKQAEEGEELKKKKPKVPTKTLHFMLANGLLDQFAGVIGNACYLRLGLLTKEKFPYLVGHIRIIENHRKPLNGNREEAIQEIRETKNMPAIRGGCLLFRSTIKLSQEEISQNRTPIPVFILRADNPQDKLLKEIDAADYMKKMNDYAKEQARVILEKEGYTGPFIVVRPNESRSNATCTNRAKLHAPIKAQIWNQGNVILSESIDFNGFSGYDLQDLCSIVEEGWVGKEQPEQKAKITLIDNRNHTGGGGYSWVA